MSGLDFLDARVRQARTTGDASHRSWPLPEEAFSARQDAVARALEEL